MRYGLPYKGSKNKIAAQIIDALPPADCFIDLFAGGCAITHAAMLSGKYNRFIINDIDPAPITLFADAIAGKYANEKRWISREDFFKYKDTDPYIKLCWSFGNNGRDYLYSAEVEPWKKAVHYARVLHDCTLLADMGISSDGSRDDIRKHHDEYRTKYNKWIRANVTGRLYDLQSLQSLQSLQRLQRLQSLQSLERLQSLQSTVGDYQVVRIPDNSLIYCDIPYYGTDAYTHGTFDHERFYAWASKQHNLYVSEYNMPPPFVPVWALTKAQLLNQYGAGAKKLEQLFIIPGNTETVKTLFDFNYI